MSVFPRRSELAHHWSLDPNTVFLNHGSFGACPKAVLEKQERLRAQIESDPVRFYEIEGDEMWAESLEVLSKFLNADPAGMAFVPNATAGVNTVLRSLALSPGDEILVPDHSYQACWNAVDFVTERIGGKTVVVPIPFPVESEEEVVEVILSHVTERTRLALIDTITSPTGLRMPFERLVGELQSRGVDVLLDAAHGPGIVQLDIGQLQPAYCAGNLHKWLCTPKGSAFLHVRDDRREGIRPLSISHCASIPGTVNERFRTEFDWPGTQDTTPWLCIPKAIEYIGGLVDGGWPRIIDRNRSLALAARKILAEALGTPLPCPDSMVSALGTVLMPEGGPVATSVFDGDPLHTSLLDDYRIQVPVFNWSHHNRRYLRVSSYLYNHIDEYRYLAESLEEGG